MKRRLAQVFMRIAWRLAIGQYVWIQNGRSRALYAVFKGGKSIRVGEWP